MSGLGLWHLHRHTCELLRYDRKNVPAHEENVSPAISAERLSRAKEFILSRDSSFMS